MIELDAAGRYTAGNRAALELLGVSLEELRRSAPERFALRPTVEGEGAALREQWESGGREPLVGTTGLRRPDGTTIRVTFFVEAVASGYRVRIWQVDGVPEAPPSVFTVGDVLREWRAAERALAELEPGTPQWTRTVSEIEMLRARYQELFKA